LILTLTINPAIDRNVIADRLVFEDRGYILESSETAGGRGINASEVLHSFGVKTVAVGIAGGANGDRLRELLASAGFPVELVPVRNQIRTNLTITDRHGLSIKLNELGPALDHKELDAVEQAVCKRLAKAEWLMLCGSLPPGAPPDFYRRLILSAHRNNVSTLLDTDGEALVLGLEAKPTVIAPNQQEAERLLSKALLTRSHFLDAVERMHAMGAQSVLMSLGARGAMGLEGERVWEAVPPRVDAVCPIGAGDALAAAFVYARRKKKEFFDALRWGVAAGTASAKLPGVTFASLEATKELYRQVEVRAVK
jgi:1-phosphofructokinase family hexose kinase